MGSADPLQCTISDESCQERIPELGRHCRTVTASVLSIGDRLQRRHVDVEAMRPRRCLIGVAFPLFSIPVIRKTALQAGRPRGIKRYCRLARAMERRPLETWRRACWRCWGICAQEREARGEKSPSFVGDIGIVRGTGWCGHASDGTPPQAQECVTDSEGLCSNQYLCASCLSHCSGHTMHELMTDTCIWNPGSTGRNCSTGNCAVTSEPETTACPDEW